MSIQLNEEQRRAVEAAGSIPARITLAGTRAVHVVLRSREYDWVHGHVPEAVADAVWAVDPRTGESYALLPESAYERIKPLFEDDPLTPAEQLALLREAGRRAGWDDPAMDVYERYRKET